MTVSEPSDPVRVMRRLSEDLESCVCSSNKSLLVSIYHTLALARR